MRRETKRWPYTSAQYSTRGLDHVACRIVITAPFLSVLFPYCAPGTEKQNIHAPEPPSCFQDLMSGCFTVSQRKTKYDTLTITKTAPTRTPGIFAATQIKWHPAEFVTGCQEVFFFSLFLFLVTFNWISMQLRLVQVIELCLFSLTWIVEPLRWMVGCWGPYYLRFISLSATEMKELTPSRYFIENVWNIGTLRTTRQILKNHWPHL